MTDTTKVRAKPFGQDKAAALATKNEALRTMTRQEAFDNGYLTVKDLDDEELRYGKCRDEYGRIPKNGKKTELIPKDQYDEMIAEHELRFKQKLRQNLDDMLDIAVEIAKDDTVEPRDRFEAAKYLMERVIGRTPETVNINVKTAPYEDLLNTVSGIGSISRAEHRRMQEQGGNAGIIDVEYTDEAEDTAKDDLQPDGIQETSEHTAEPDVVQVHQPRPGEPDAVPSQTALVRQEPNTDTQVRKFVDGEPTFGRDPAKPEQRAEQYAPVQVDTPDPYLQYGSRRTEEKSYAEQARDAQDLAQRRKEAKDKIRNATKQRKIARATGADAFTTDITGATVDEDGNLTFD